MLTAPTHFRNLLTREHADAEFAGQLANHVIRALRPGTRGAARE